MTCYNVDLAHGSTLFMDTTQSAVQETSGTVNTVLVPRSSLKVTADAFDNDSIRHFLIISIKEADITQCRSRHQNGAFNPYCSVHFECPMSGEGRTIETRKIYDSDGNPHWNFVKRYEFESVGHLPEVIKFTVLDFDETDTVEFGHCVFEHEAHGAATSGKWHCSHPDIEQPLDGGHGTLKFGIYYKCCSLSDLKSEMRSATASECSPNVFDHSALEWVKVNTALIIKMKMNEKHGVGITAEDFSDLSNPPYPMVKDQYRVFLRNYGHIQRFTNPLDSDGSKNREHLQIYYDEDSDVLYFSNANEAHYGGENVTSQVLCIWRFVFLRDVLLKFLW